MNKPKKLKRPVESSLEELLKRISYKPEYRFEVILGMMSDALFLRLTSQVPDSNNPSNRITVVSQQDLYFNAGAVPDQVLIGLIRDAVIKRELHEVDEWLKLDGKHLMDPHPELVGGLEVFRG